MNLLNLFRRPAGLKDMDAEQLERRLEISPRPVIIDVRTALEYNSGHVQSARHCPLGKETQLIEELDKQAPLVLLCKTGHRSQAAARTLLDMGFSDISHLAGGMDRWKKERRPLQK